MPPRRWPRSCRPRRILVSTPDKSWSSYDQEQRAQIVDQWFGRYYIPNKTSTGFGLETAAALENVAYRNHIGPHIRTGRP